MRCRLLGFANNVGSCFSKFKQQIDKLQWQYPSTCSASTGPAWGGNLDVQPQQLAYAGLRQTSTWSA